ncbi:bifunctional DNA primase/polymerase [Mycobacterium shinjukuense]|nr:bifunctional DNA primase/polymerase [Mycobacterium shinjukuense]ORB70129.1 DNA primase [Mycobacterium shinjukuense]
MRAINAALGGATIVGGDIAAAAVEYAVNHWQVLPLRGKVPAIAGGRGVLDATDDVATVARWWGGEHAGANIGGRVPESMVVIDVDPRHGGNDSIARHERRHGRLPETLTTLSGRGDGGRHLFFRRPAGKLSGRRLGPGLDVKTSSGYTVLPPSIHAGTGQPYRRVVAPVAAPPAWLVALLLPERARPATRRRPRHLPPMRGASIADRYSAATSWHDVLVPRGWRCLDTDPDADGARWVHPTHTSACSATIRHGCLFVYSTNTPFDVTEPGNPKGYTRFRAYATLNHNGDLKAAARALKETVQ